MSPTEIYVGLESVSLTIIFSVKFISLLTQILDKAFCNPAGAACLLSEPFDEIWSHLLCDLCGFHPWLEFLSSSLSVALLSGHIAATVGRVFIN